jgi:phosphatidylserine synthase
MLPAMKAMENTDTPLIFFMGIPLMLGFLMYASIRYLSLKGFSEYLQALIALVLGYILYSFVQTILIYLGAYLMVVL